MKSFIHFYYCHRKLCLSLTGLLVLVAIFNLPDIAFAATPPDPEAGKLTRDINEIVNMAIRFSGALLWPVLLMIGSLLDNDLIFGGAMGERLLDVWVQIRNLVNIVFVVVLLAIAVYNVLGLGEEGGGLPLAFKTVMPKFVIALIAVNFSFLASKVVLDFTNVITGAVFALPTNVSGGNKYDLDKSIESVICSVPSQEVSMKPLWCDGEKLNERAKSFFSRLDRSNITLAYAVQFSRAPQLKFIREGLKDLGQLGFNILFNAVLYFVYAASFIALFFVLLFRVVVLWIGVVLSPVIALSIVLPDLKELGGAGGEFKDKFVKHAIAPIKIGLVLSVGYIMLRGFEADKSIHGAILSSSSLAAIDPNALPTDITDLQQLLVAMGVIAIVWIGVFTAADETAAKSITGLIRDKGQAFGKWAAKLPTYLQVIPTGGKFGRESATIAELVATAKHLPLLVEQKRGRSFFEQRPPSVEEISAWKAASHSVGTFAEAFKKTPHLIATPEGWEIFKNTMIGPGKIKPEEFPKQFGSGHQDADTERTKLAIAKIPEFRSAGVTPQVIDNAIRAKKAEGPKPPEPAKPVTKKEDVVEALKENTAAAALKKYDLKNKNWTDEQIEALVTLPERLKASVLLLLIKEDMKPVDVRIATALKTLSEGLHLNQTLEGANTAINVARGSGVEDKIITAVVKVSELKEDVKTSALNTSQPKTQ